VGDICTLSNLSRADRANHPETADTLLNQPSMNHFSLMDILSPRDQWVDHGCLAFLFVHLGQEAEARILLESSLLKMRNGTILSGFECSRCHKRRGKGPFYACSECQSTILCDECYVKRSDEWLQIGPALGITRSSLAHQLINP